MRWNRRARRRLLLVILLALLAAFLLFVRLSAAPVVQALPFTNTALGRILKREKPDIIHTRLSAAALIGGWWGRRMGIPVVETIDKYPKLKYYRDASMIFPCSTAVM